MARRKDSGVAVQVRPLDRSTSTLSEFYRYGSLREPLFKRTPSDFKYGFHVQHPRKSP
ncbi:Uncharacterised protein [Yersinia similis]|nr:Uncharacterised protein [Yersinia similis]